MMNAMKKLSNINDVENTLSVTPQHILTMTNEEIDKVKVFESQLLQFPQMAIPTSHIIHGGMYSRTIKVPAGRLITGSLMKIATLLIIQGDFVLFAGDDAIELNGYYVFTGGPNRKQAGVARGDTWVTMIFPTESKTIEEAEAEFTDEYEFLASRSPEAVNHIIITAE